MSRTGKKPILIPEKVKVNVAPNGVFVEGPLGKLQLTPESWVKVLVKDKTVVIERIDDSREARQAHGLARALINNLVYGVSSGFEKKLEIQGVGYRAEVKGETLSMTLGFSHPVVFDVPKGIKIGVVKQTELTVTGSDKGLVGQVAANIRSLRPPEPYKGKGIRYKGEVIKLKAGKQAAGAGAAAGGGGGGGKK